MYIYFIELKIGFVIKLKSVLYAAATFLPSKISKQSGVYYLFWKSENLRFYSGVKALAPPPPSFPNLPMCVYILSSCTFLPWTRTMTMSLTVQRSSLNQRRRFFFQNFMAKNGDAIDTLGSTLFNFKLQNCSKWKSWKRMCLMLRIVAQPSFITWSFG